MSARTMVGLFAGIGGLELGLSEHGWQTELLCEIDAGAQAVLRHHFQNVDLRGDITRLRALPAGTELVAAGFPCQDLSQAGRTAGIRGSRSGLVEHAFRLIRRKQGPTWLLLENVPFMLRLDRGQAMRYLTESLEEMGYRWAYRVIDANAFGLPQRRQRVVLLASRTEDPRGVLFGEDAVQPTATGTDEVACGFYWTEGIRGLGWAVDAVPTLKGGSTIGIASPPAIRLAATRRLVTPGITDAERLQGFDPEWTRPALRVPGVRPGHRWKLIGNAVSTRMSSWVGHRLSQSAAHDTVLDRRLQSGSTWPTAAWGENGAAYEVAVSMWPRAEFRQPLEPFVEDPRPLSVRATAGFLGRAERSTLRFPPGFLDDVNEHLAAMRTEQTAAA